MNKTPHGDPAQSDDLPHLPAEDKARINSQLLHRLGEVLGWNRSAS